MSSLGAIHGVPTGYNASPSPHKQYSTIGEEGGVIEACMAVVHRTVYPRTSTVSGRGTSGVFTYQAARQTLLAPK